MLRYVSEAKQISRDRDILVDVVTFKIRTILSKQDKIKGYYFPGISLTISASKLKFH